MKYNDLQRTAIVTVKHPTDAQDTTELSVEQFSLLLEALKEKADTSNDTAVIELLYLLDI